VDSGGSGFVTSKEEVADFMKQSRRLALNEDDDEKNLGPAWGGSEYSLSSGITVSSWSTKSFVTVVVNGISTGKVTRQ